MSKSANVNRGGNVNVDNSDSVGDNVGVHVNDRGAGNTGVHLEAAGPRWIDALFGAAPQSWQRRAASPAEMQFLLERERARSDRNQQEFAVITLQAASPSFASPLWNHLLQFLPTRLRVTDDYGWLDDDDCLSVVLPNTDVEGAWRVADDIIRSCPMDFPPPHCTVHRYPCGWSSSDPTATPEIWKSDLDGEEVSHRESHMEAFFVGPTPVWKRFIDVVGALFALILAAPVMGAVAIAIKLTSRGPVLFRQQRAGLGGRPFTILKFRTMVVDAESQRNALLDQNEQDGPAFKIRKDPRITPLGWFLRKTSIDELPQLFNVLRGDMSLVGPRPLPCHEAAGCDVWQWRRMDVTPGITCTWQIEGRSRVTFSEWVRMDVRYARNRSLGGDLKLLWRTVLTVLTKADGC
jgi:lipopolysaccharide/colanic/teichoic acid biosynthesis glycosyltransferase